MESFSIAIGTAFWLGILTSISPCPLATNITAMSFIARRMDRLRDVWLAGFLYAAGRMLSYMVIASLVVSGLLSIPGVSFALQRYLNNALGPLLLVIGSFLLGWINLPGLEFDFIQRLHGRAENLGGWGAGFLGVLFALSFCPVSAGLFFGSLIPLSLKHTSRFMLPALFGFGTGLPVALAAALTAGSANAVGRFFNRVTRFNRWAERITGAVFVLAGIYYTWVYLVGPRFS